MSHNTSTVLEIRDVACLKAALVDALGLLESEIEIHAEPVTIHDYYGKIPRPAHLVIRKAALARALGEGWADAGFHFEGANATFTHDNLDRKLANSYGRIKGHYSKHVTMAQARKKGLHPELVIENGKARIRVRVR